ncbi:hypothetical protein DXG01_012361 [Tephrocybe rancida]|nr:hypothetical protein DXG01_012361 [Tephrocybe rancida]
MATNLYETLGIPRTATPEQIRKAYKKKALQTHPDRLPPGASQEDKTASEELFRKEYDLHGIWPPQEPEAAPMPQRSTNGGHRPHTQRRHEPRNDFFPGPWDMHRSSFGFTDPFELFDAIFDHVLPTSHHRHHRHERPWFASQLSRMMDDDFDPPGFGFGFGMGFPPGFGRSLMPPQPPSFFGGGNGGQWQVESYVSSSINGVTQTSHKRRDWNGNEHVTHTYADGRTVHTVNGVEQPPVHGHIRDNQGPPPSGTPRGTHGSRRRTSSPPPAHGGNTPAGQGTIPMIADRPYGHGSQNGRNPETHLQAQPQETITPKRRGMTALIRNHIADTTEKPPGVDQAIVSQSHAPFFVFYAAPFAM